MRCSYRGDALARDRVVLTMRIRRELCASRFGGGAGFRRCAPQARQCFDRVGIEMDEALHSFAAALAIKPENPDAKFNEALTRLCLGDFRQGLAELANVAGKDLNTPRNGQLIREGRSGAARSDLRGKTISPCRRAGPRRCHPPARYVPLVAALRSAKVLLEVRPALTALMATVPAGVAQHRAAARRCRNSTCTARS